MTQAKQVRSLEPVHAGEDEEAGGVRWPYWLVVFLRVMAGLSLLKGLYHWAVVCGMNAPGHAGFDSYPVPYQIATAFFAVIDLVAAVGLWLAAPWGAVIWLTSVISMIAVELLFPQVYGGSIVVVVIESALLAIYLFLAIMAARSQTI
jgi:Family of unknown function (DUF6163)